MCRISTATRRLQQRAWSRASNTTKWGGGSPDTLSRVERDHTRRAILQTQEGTYGAIPNSSCAAWFRRDMALRQYRKKHTLPKPKPSFFTWYMVAKPILPVSSNGLHSGHIGGGVAQHIRRQRLVGPRSSIPFRRVSRMSTFGTCEALASCIHHRVCPLTYEHSRVRSVLCVYCAQDSMIH